MRCVMRIDVSLVSRAHMEKCSLACDSRDKLDSNGRLGECLL